MTQLKNLMTNMKNKNLVLILLAVFIIISCSDNKGDKKASKKNLGSKYIFSIKHFPDTVLVDKIYEGEIEYESELDTINLPNEDERFIFLYITTQKGSFKDIEAIKKVEHEVFKIDKNGIIAFRFKFKNTGVNYFNGMIEDMVILNNHYKDGKARIITHLTEIKKEVFVIDKNESN